MHLCEHACTVQVQLYVNVLSQLSVIMSLGGRMSGGQNGLDVRVRHSTRNCDYVSIWNFIAASLLKARKYI